MGHSADHGSPSRLTLSLVLAGMVTQNSARRDVVVGTCPANMRKLSAVMETAGWAWAAGCNEDRTLYRLRGAAGQQRGVQVTWQATTRGFSLAGCLAWGPDGAFPRKVTLDRARALIAGGDSWTG